MGLVAVALLTLAPLALRPVRLACLIHAANVHSEPGSNPSIMIRSPRPERRQAGPHLQRVEEFSAGRNEARRRGKPPGRPRCRLVVHPRRGPPPTGSGAAPGTASTPASLAGPQLTTEPRSTGLSKRRGDV